MSNLGQLSEVMTDLAGREVQPLWELDNVFLNPFVELPPILAWGRIGNNPSIEKQGIITISAKPKQGKSYAVYSLLTSLISMQPIDTFTPIEQPKLCIIFDTEMNEATLLRRAKGVYKAIGEQQHRLAIVPLLKVKKSERIGIIEQITAKYNPDIVAIDIVTKLISDFNDAKENQYFSDWLEKYAADRTVITVIHQNKGKDDTNMQGHLGTALNGGAVENYSASHENGYFTLKTVNARSADTSEAKEVNFVLNPDGTTSGAQQVVEEKLQAEKLNWIANMKQIFCDKESLGYNEIVKTICDKENLSEKSARTKLKKCIELGVILKCGNERQAPYKIARF